MPSLDTVEKIEKITLNGYAVADPAWVEIDMQPFTAEEVANYEAATSGAEVTYDLLSKRIKKWNLTVTDAAAGNEITAPINTSTVRKIRMAAFEQLSNLLQPLLSGLDEPEKKS